MKTDIQIAQEAIKEPITRVAERAGVPEEALELYGRYKAKIRASVNNDHFYAKIR